MRSRRMPCRSAARNSGRATWWCSSCWQHGAQRIRSALPLHPLRDRLVRGRVARVKAEHRLRALRRLILQNPRPGELHLRVAQTVAQLARARDHLGIGVHAGQLDAQAALFAQVMIRRQRQERPAAAAVRQPKRAGRRPPHQVRVAEQFQEMIDLPELLAHRLEHAALAHDADRFEELVRLVRRERIFLPAIMRRRRRSCFQRGLPREISALPFRVMRTCRSPSVH